MSINQLEQVRRLRKIWPYRVYNIFSPSGSPYDGLTLLLMTILNQSKIIAEYGAHTGDQSAFLASMTDAVGGKFIGIDDWSYFNSPEEKSKLLINANLEFLGIRDYEIVTADCNTLHYVDADFYYWDICRSNTPLDLVASLHQLINIAKSKPFMICIDDVVREHPYGNKEFLDVWKNSFSKITGMDVTLVTENKIFLANYQIDSKINSVLELLMQEKILCQKTEDKFYNASKYVGNFFDVSSWSSKLVTQESFWNKLENIFKN